MIYGQKPKMTFYGQRYWCVYRGCTGCGKTMREAWDDMWTLYDETYRHFSGEYINPRAG